MQTQILGLVTPLMALFFAAMFVVIWRVGRMKRHVLGFGLAFALSATGFLVTHFLPADAFYTFHITQVFYSLGSITMLASVCERAGQRLHLGSVAFVYAVTALVLALAISLTSDVGPRLILVNMGYGVMFAMGATTLLTAGRRDAIDTLILAVVVFQAADFMIRPSLTLLFETTIPAAVYRDSIYYSLIGLVLGIKGVVTAMVLIGATIAEWTKNLRESSEKDVLTGLLNRAAFEQEMHGLLPRAQTEGRPLTLVVADIDHFKQVNDIWGHQSGDRAIASFGELIQQTIRGCDIAGRIGGEEFCIAVWNCPNEPGERLAQRIREAFANLQHAGLNDDIRLTASFGVATARAGETYERLFARADAALYQAKSSGRDCVQNAERERADGPVLAADRAPTQMTRTAANS